MSLVKEFTKGFWNELPPFRLVLGLCPTLAVTKTAYAGLGMGLATTFVLVCSNILISMLRNVIPPKVRIASFILIIASFVVIVEMMMHAFVFNLYEVLGLFIPLIVVNCIVLGRAEAFASKNGIILSMADGLGIGLGFTMSLALLGAIRELLGAGTFLGGTPAKMLVFGESFQPFSFMVEAPGAFVALGLMLGLIGFISRKYHV